jgi:hypothetical protein
VNVPAKLPPELADADTVGVIYDFTDGLNFYKEYRMPRDLFADPALASGKRYTDALRGYSPVGDNRPAAVSPSGRRLSLGRSTQCSVRSCTSRISPGSSTARLCCVGESPGTTSTSPVQASP